MKFVGALALLLAAVHASVLPRDFGLRIGTDMHKDPVILEDNPDLNFRISGELQLR